MSKKISRRTALKLLGATAAGASVVGWPALRARRAFAQNQKPYFLITLTCTGGASLIDSFLAIRESECANWREINCFPDAEVIDAPTETDLRVVRIADDTLNNPAFTGSIPLAPFHANPDLMAQFALNNLDDLLVVTHTGTSVNHTIAQKRALTGNSAMGGRTVQEAVAAAYGEGFALPNVNMGFGGFIEPGTDDTLPGYALHEPVSQPFTFPLALDGGRGIQGAPTSDLLNKARALREQKLEPESDFYQRVSASRRIQAWKEQRENARQIEDRDLITKLQFVPDSPPSIPLGDYGLAESPDGQLVRSTFPEWLVDPLESQAALAFLLIKYQVSCAVTIGPNFNLQLDGGGQFVQTPLAFDNSHGAHRYTQAAMWHRVLSVADRLITLLKATTYDPDTGETFWDRTLIYFATDFGRTKKRPVGMGQNGEISFGSSHDLNNGSLIASPLVNGNTLLGGVDPDTGMTYGFDRVTGEPRPNETMAEADVFAGLLQALQIDTSGTSLPDMPAMVG
jgi:hypothetical protein